MEADSQKPVTIKTEAIVRWWNGLQVALFGILNCPIERIALERCELSILIPDDRLLCK